MQIFHKVTNAMKVKKRNFLFDFSTMELLLRLDDYAWQGVSVCGGKSRSDDSYHLLRPLSLRRPPERLGLSLLALPPGKVQASDRVYFRFWRMLGGTTQHHSHLGELCGSMLVVLQPGKTRRERPAFDFQHDDERHGVLH